MPFIESDRARIHYRLDGSQSGPIIVLSNSLGTNLCMWDGQVPALAARFRVLRYDTRGHGQSSVTPGPYSIMQLGRDVVHLLDELEIECAHFCGLSMGGMTGMWLGVYAASRIERLVLCNTAAKIGTAEIWNARIEAVRQGGMAAIVDSVIQRWFTPGFIARAPETIKRTRQMILGTPPEGYMANCGAIRDMDQRETISHISAPTLVIAGLHDPVTTRSDAQYIVERVAGAQCAELDAAHLSNIGAAERFTQVLFQFLAGAP
jgi:3-oxoadipate enol-lactonase